MAYLDDLTDEELRDPNRAGYAAMPIVLPNGQLNANRFGVPPSDKAVVVRFQDRFWYAVDTSGNQPNTILYSEVDEPESVPDINEIILQQNARDSDAITALMPFGPMLIVMQARSAHSLSFAKQPVLDAQVTPIAYRGAVNQRCWCLLDGVAYVIDQYGVYSLAGSGQIEAISQPVDDIFITKTDYAKSKWFFVSADPALRVIRVFIALKGDGSAGYPTLAMCYHIDSKTWWQERYPMRLSGACGVRLSNGDNRVAYAGRGGIYLLNEGSCDLARGAVIQTVVTNVGSGYKKPPTVRAEGGSGAEFQASIDASGKVCAIWIKSMGYGYKPGSSAPDNALYISPPDVEGGTQATAIFVATPMTSDTTVFTAYRVKTGAMGYATDADDPKAAATNTRNIRVQYQPQPSPCELAMRLYYNNSQHPRPNVAGRNRGVGFVASTVDSGGRLDMGGNISKYGEDGGVASAMLSGRSMDDIASSDRAVAVELSGARKTQTPVVVYEIDVGGTAK
jgi:hypothetical protein